MKSIGILLNIDPDHGKERGTLFMVKPNQEKSKPLSELTSPKNKDSQLIQILDNTQRNKRKLPKPFYSDTQTETSFSCKRKQNDLLVNDEPELFVDWSNMSSLHNKEGSGL